jgi:hypothetical protein
MNIGKRFHRPIFIFAILAVMCLMLIPATPSLALTGTINISPSLGTVGTTITITGSGFTAGSAYTAKFEETIIAVGNVGTGGSFTTTCEIPPYARGSHQISVTTSSSDISNIVHFTVIPSIQTDIDSGHVGEQVDVSGNGFAAYSDIEIYFDNDDVASSRTNARGSFFGAIITVPETLGGGHSIAASDGIYAPAVTFQVVPMIELNPMPEKVGDRVSISGSGYGSEAELYFYIDGYAVDYSSTVTDTNGNFTANNFTIPALQHGNHILTVRDERYNVATKTFSISQGLTISPGNGPAGTLVTLNGNGFGINRDITLNFGGLNVGDISPAQIYSDVMGSFTVTFVVAESHGGVYTISATDNTYSATVNFSVTGSAVLSSTAGPAGSTVTVTGSSFLAGNTVIVRYEGLQLASAITDNLGNFTTTLKIPDSPAGNHAITVADSTSTVTIYFTVTPNATLNYDHGYVGSPVIINGTGFAAISPVSINFDGNNVAKATTNSNGVFSANFAVPNSWGGDHRIVVSDGTNQASLVFTVLASAELSPQSTSVGADITMSGNGFTSSGVINISYDGVQVGSTIADTSGSFTRNVTTPAGPYGKHTLTVTDGHNTIALAFDVIASLVLDPASGYVGSSVVVHGYGFAAGRSITVDYAGSQVAQGTSDENGSFSVTFKAPASSGGNHDVSATDGASTATAVFSMDATPPDAPAPIMPMNGSKEKIQTSFVWGPVPDPSGVTYTLEVATDPVFQDVVLKKADLKDAGYTLTTAEELKPVSHQTPYYWRVMAVDGAGNESPWSAYQSFYVGFVLPTWALYTIFVVSAVILAGITYWLGRRTARAKPAKGAGEEA